MERNGKKRRTRSLYCNEQGDYQRRGLVGPTKNDMTINGVAAALDVTIENNEEKWLR
jgi:hypothetical protein